MKQTSPRGLLFDLMIRSVRGMRQKNRGKKKTPIPNRAGSNQMS
jgi:hypothetical protein